jgi:hypothetical protein
MTERQCSSCGGFCKRSGCERENVKRPLNASAEYERGFIDGMQKQMQSSVDKAVNRMATPQKIEKLEAQLGEAVWNYGEAKRLNAQLLEALESMVASCWSDGFTNRKYNSDEHEENVQRDLVLAAIAAVKEKS